MYMTLHTRATTTVNLMHAKANGYVTFQPKILLYSLLHNRPCILLQTRCVISYNTSSAPGGAQG